MTSDDQDLPPSDIILAVENDKAGAAQNEEPTKGISTSTGANDEAILIRIRLLEEEHADLDKAIYAMSAQPGKDHLAIARLKKKKLLLKEQIVKLRDTITPDIIA
ncbi:MAG: DUF465 domain-containing protein [Pseudomonadota bacterium]